MGQDKKPIGTGDDENKNRLLVNGNPSQFSSSPTV